MFPTSLDVGVPREHLNAPTLKTPGHQSVLRSALSSPQVMSLEVLELSSNMWVRLGFIIIRHVLYS